MEELCKEYGICFSELIFYQIMTIIKPVAIVLECEDTMGNWVKQLIFDYQLKKCHSRYRKEKARLNDPYHLWIDEIESKSGMRQEDGCGGTAITKISFDKFVSFLRKEVNADSQIPEGWFVTSLCEGDCVMPTAGWKHLFTSSSETGLIYGDEDMADQNTGARYGAWFKPDYSPDTLLSFFYFGSVLFLKGNLVKEAFKGFVPSVKEGGDRQCLYDFILFYIEFLGETNRKVMHIPQVLFHGKGDCYEPEDPKKPEVVNRNAYWGYEPEYDVCRLAAIERRGYRAHMRENICEDRVYHIPVYDVCGKDEKSTAPGVSVVIPSKDNPKVLEVCIRSLYEKTDYPDFEVIVVDNGSSEANRARIWELKLKYGFTYIYEPMDFNFSKMCNMGVDASEKEYILLLNDDMEILQPDWMRVMVGQAAVGEVGAVGAKLLYPDSGLIQHAGITNLWVGPAHKLLKEKDDRDYYYGRNILPYDMIGVTAACLLVSREKYREAGNFCEDIAVSYNDVDFCFSLYDLGYRNVIRNDVVLYHHESLSRGDDTLSDEKWERLLREKDFVYTRYPQLKGKDPYYNPNLAGFKHKYFCSWLYPYEQRKQYNELKDFKQDILPEWHNECLTITLEHVRLERKLDLDEERDVYWLEGWAYVLNMDNSRYKRKLLLIDKNEKMYELSLYDRYRQDVVDILPEQTNVGISGFSCRVKKEDLQPGEYRVALLYRDCCSRQRLYRECEERMVVT